MIYIYIYIYVVKAIRVEQLSAFQDRMKTVYYLTEYLEHILS